MDIMDLLAQARPASLDQQPDPARRASDLARAVAGTAARPGVRPHRRVRWPVRPARLIAIGTSIVAVGGTAAAVAALSATGTPMVHRAPAAAHRGTVIAKPSEVRNAILTAFNDASGDVLHTKLTEIYPGTESKWNSVIEDWSFPLQPQVGQTVHERDMTLPLPPNRENKTDTEFIYTEPASTQSGSTPAVNTKVISVRYDNRTWFNGTSLIAFESGDGPSSQDLREWILNGKFPDARKTELNGQAVLELTIPDNDSTWWVNLATYLPVRELIEDGGVTLQTDYEFLPPTPANIAQVKVNIPAGFTRTSAPKLPS